MDCLLETQKPGWEDSTALNSAKLWQRFPRKMLLAGELPRGLGFELCNSGNPNACEIGAIFLWICRRSTETLPVWSPIKQIFSLSLRILMFIRPGRQWVFVQMKRNLSQIVTLSPTDNRRLAATGGLGTRGSPSTKNSPSLLWDKKNISANIVKDPKEMLLSSLPPTPPITLHVTWFLIKMEQSRTTFSRLSRQDLPT